MNNGDSVKFKNKKGILELLDDDWINEVGLIINQSKNDYDFVKTSELSPARILIVEKIKKYKEQRDLDEILLKKYEKFRKNENFKFKHIIILEETIKEFDSNPINRQQTNITADL